MSILEKAGAARNSERILVAEVLQELRSYAQQHTEVIARLDGRLANDVLLVETATFDANATPIARQFRVAAGSIEVRNLGTHDITVNSAGPGSSAPTIGVGVYVVPAGTTAVVNVASHQVTLYGTAGDRVSFQVFARGGVSSTALSGIDGGAA